MIHLYAHQQRIVNEAPKKAGLFLGTGSGKTRTALVLAKGSVLVIAPKTQVEDRNWQRENEKLGGAGVLSLTVMSKETFRRDHRSLGRFDTVIVDEAHTCLGVTPNVRQRNKVQIPKASQLFEALDAYVKRTKPERIYLATATILKSPFTVWAAGRILGKFKGDMASFLKFRQMFYVKLPMPGRDVWVPKKHSSVKDLLAKTVRSLGYVGRLEDYFDVPEQTFKTHHVELTAAQRARLKDIAVEFPDPIVRLGKRHQVENGVLAGDEFSVAEVFSNEKLDAILDYASEFPRIVIFAKYRAQISALQIALEKAKYRVLTLTGDTKDRGEVIRAANEAKECILIAQAQVSAGWELPEYPVMIFASRTYSFVDYDQALGRIQRANNIKKNLYITLVVKGGVDEAVDDALANKQDFNERLYAEQES